MPKKLFPRGPYEWSCVMMLVIALLVCAGCGQKGAESAAAPLKVGIIPFEDVGVIQKAFAPFASYLGKKAGRPGGQVFVTPSYAGVLQALQSDQIDVAYLNPLSYVLAVQQFQNTPEHLVPLGMPYFHHSLTYRGIIFVRADSGITTLQGLKGKSVAFADRTSTSGYLYPARLLKDAGVDPVRDIKAVNMSGTVSVNAVYSGQAAGGATYEGGIVLACTDPVTGKVDEAKVKQFRVLATTAPIPNGMIVARANLDPAEIAKLKQAVSIDINSDPDGQAALKAIPSGGWDKMVPPDDTIFDSVRENAKIFGLNLQSLDQQKKYK
jgi:phosphonate transport system substrate-binding protein